MLVLNTRVVCLALLGISGAVFAAPAHELDRRGGGYYHGRYMYAAIA